MHLQAGTLSLFRSHGIVSFVPPVRAGRWYHSQLACDFNLSGIYFDANRLYAEPFWCVAPAVAKEIGLYEGTAVAGHVHLGLYRDQDGEPGALLLDIGEKYVALGAGYWAIDQALAPGIYWLALIADTSLCFAYYYSAGYTGLMGFNSPVDTTSRSLYVDLAYGALPDPFPRPTVLGSGVVPYLFLGF